MGKEVLESRVAGTTSLGQKVEGLKGFASTTGGARRFRPVTGESMIFGGWLLVSLWIWVSYQGHFCFSVQDSWETGGPRSQLYNLLGVCGRLEEMTISKYFVCMCGRRERMGLAFDMALNAPLLPGTCIPTLQGLQIAGTPEAMLHTCPCSP